jgi:hypothetical protein
MFSLQQSWRTRGRNRFCPEAGSRREVAQIIYTHERKCKSDKIKKKPMTHIFLGKTVMYK